MKKSITSLSLLVALATGAFADNFYSKDTGQQDFSKLEWYKDSARTEAWGEGVTPGQNNTLILDNATTSKTVYHSTEIYIGKLLSTSTSEKVLYTSLDATTGVKHDVIMRFGSIEFDTTTAALRLQGGTVVVDNDINTTGVSGNSGNLWIGHTGHEVRVSGGLEVSGNVINTISMGIVATRVRSADFAGGFENADVEVKGFVKTSTGSSVNIHTSNKTNNYGGNLYVKFGGLLGDGTITSKLTLGGTKGITHVKFTNDGTREIDNALLTESDFAGNISENSGASSFKFYMDADKNAVQKLSSSSLKFTGGVEMQSGKLLVNYGDTSKVSHGTLTFSGTDANATKFGNSSESVGNFVFDSIAVNGDGTILVKGTGVTDANNYDVITATNGMSGNGTLTFEFEDAASFVGSAEDAHQVISWATKDDASGIKITGQKLDGYDFNHFFADDGLYVYYSAAAVPEPSTYAAIFGVLALGLAIYRRRK